MKNYINRIENAFNKYKAELSLAEEELKPKVSFGYFEIFWSAQIQNVALSHKDYLCHLDECLEIIKKNGVLTLEDLEKLSVF